MVNHRALLLSSYPMQRGRSGPRLWESRSQSRSFLMSELGVADCHVREVSIPLAFSATFTKITLGIQQKSLMVLQVSYWNPLIFQRDLPSSHPRHILLKPLDPCIPMSYPLLSRLHGLLDLPDPVPQLPFTQANASLRSWFTGPLARAPAPRVGVILGRF